jgi:preprotein translocase subunit Sss1
MRKPLVTTTNVATAAGVLIVGFLGYVFFTSLPDLRRYVRMSTM